MKDKKPLQLKFSALDPFIVDNLMKSDEKLVKAQGFIEFGTRNKFPNYLFDLYRTVPTLGSIINSVVDYGAGDQISSTDTLWKNEKEITDFCRKILLDLCIYGGSYLNVQRSRLGNVAKLSVLDYRCVRSDRGNDVFYYSEDFRDDKSYGRCKMTVYPAYNPDRKDVANSIYYIKTTHFSTYAVPLWIQAQIACEMEKKINEFSINEIDNGFVSNVIVNFNNGKPTDEEQAEIEEMVDEKFCGSENAGRPLLSFNDDFAHRTTIEKLQVDNLNERYAATQQRAKQEILTAWRCNGNLVGIPTAQGFNSEEYQSAYQLFYKTVVKPLQQHMTNAIDDILEKDEVIRIIPFTLDFGEDRVVS